MNFLLILIAAPAAILLGIVAVAVLIYLVLWVIGTLLGAKF